MTRLAGSDCDLADLDMIARTGTSIGALQTVEPDDFKAFILRIGVNRAGGGRALAGNLDDVALLQAMFGHEFARKAGQAAPRILGPGIGNLEFAVLLLCHSRLPLVQAPDFQDRATDRTGQRAKKEAGKNPAFGKSNFRRGCL
jgi:hypothetical protein